jgi:hypothetical protein
MDWRLILVSLGILACSSSRTNHRVDGSYAIECSSRKACLDHAERICGESGYTIVGGRHDQKLYGVPGNQKVVGKDELYIRCNTDKIVDAPDPAVGSWKLERRDAGASQGPSPNPKNTVCRPGETIRCVGAGACEGGQACTEDGTKFGPCDCGGQSSGHSPQSKEHGDAGNR